MDTRRSHLTLMIKPASAACNLRCDYCFYFDEVANRDVGIRPMMGHEVVASIITKSIELAKHITYAFQGGEPSLAGLAFFERFVSMVEQYKKDDTLVSYAFQTNGLLIDETWAQFFKKYHFLVGVSLDGPPRLNDLHRHDREGTKSGRLVMQNIALMQKIGVEFNILSVVTNELAQNISMVFPYFVNHGLLFHQYIACMDPLEGGRNFLSAEVYATFLKQLFDLWYAAWQSGKPVSVRFFDNLVGMIAGYPPESCDMSGVCSANYVVESNGDIYPCDFYCIDEELLGNIITDSFSALDEKRKELRFIEDSPNRIDACVHCPWAALCRGGCKRYRTEQGYRFCTSMQEFFPYAIRRLETVARTLSDRK
ncbi:MAG: SPASM domain-containing protein [Spirochaetia bacterium]|nr:SPASM domain-containing protein [Spirochaetia bacterium]